MCGNITLPPRIFFFLLLPSVLSPPFPRGAIGSILDKVRKRMQREKIFRVKAVKVRTPPREQNQRENLGNNPGKNPGIRKNSQAWLVSRLGV